MGHFSVGKRRLAIRILIASWTVVTLLSSPVSAALLCRQVHNLSTSVSRVERILGEARAQDTHLVQDLEILRTRMVRYFQARKRQFDPFDVKVESEMAQAILQRLVEQGSAIDIEIFSTYFQIFEATEMNVVYSANQNGYTPVGPEHRLQPSFQTRHWGWTHLDSYFFDSPSITSFNKSRDLEYLKRVNSVARSGAIRRGLADVIREADRSWHLSHLEAFPTVREAFLGFENGRSYEKLKEVFQRQVEQWIGEGSNSPDLVATRKAAITSALSTFVWGKNGSSFDLFVFSKYFEVLQQHPKAKFATWFDISEKKPRGDWYFDGDGLATGSVDFVIDYLLQKSHDSAAKAYLWHVLDRMHSLPHDESFARVFTQARRQVDREIHFPAPEHYQADLHIFTLGGFYTSVGRDGRAGHVLGHPTLNEVVVRWNSQVGHLEEVLVNRMDIQAKAETPVGENALVSKYLKQYFQVLEASGAYSPAQISQFQATELKIPMARTRFLVFTEPGTEHLMAMVRVFDGNPIRYFQEFRQANQISQDQTNIELEYRIALPARRSQQPVYELGRLYATDQTAANSLEVIMTRVADYLANTNGRGDVYMEASQARMLRFSRMGAQVVYRPEDLALSATDVPVWILKVPVAQILHQFDYNTYSTVRRRARPNN